MGQSASSNKKVRKQKDSLSSHPTANVPTVAASSQNETQDLSKFCKRVQNRKYAGLKSEFDTDIEEFVLNNLLMCIDLFDDFERAKEEAESFKIEKEAELNHSHEDISTNNRMIQGPLQYRLLTGMSHVLANNFIYKNRAPLSPDIIGDAILPVDFAITWRNIQIFQSLDKTEIMKFEDAALDEGFEFCPLVMEEAKDKNNVQQGYVRLWSGRNIDHDEDVEDNLYDDTDIKENFEEIEFNGSNLGISDCIISSATMSSSVDTWVARQKSLTGEVLDNIRPSQPCVSGRNSRVSLSSGYNTMEKSSVITSSSRPRSMSSTAISHESSLPAPLQVKSIDVFPVQQRYSSNKAPILPSCFSLTNGGAEHLISPDSDSDSLSNFIGDVFLHRITNNNNHSHNNNNNATYCLNSNTFLDNFCSDFRSHYNRNILDCEISDALVIGASVQSGSVNEIEGVTMTNNFTPSLNCDRFPPKSYFRFNRRINSKTRHPDNANLNWWLNPTVMENIEICGCNAIPLGPIEDANSLHWELDFFNVESLLLSNFHELHWRSYIFAGLIFRAFLHPLGHQGVGLIHIRHLLYNLAHDVPLTTWTVERQGVHLKMLLDNLYIALSKSKLHSFFTSEQNLFKNIPRANLSAVQSQLKIVLDNLLVSCICALRNLVRPLSAKRSCQEGQSLDYKKLFKIVTVDESDLLTIINPDLGPFDREVVMEMPRPPRRASGRRKSSIWEMDKARHGHRYSIAACQNDIIEECKWKSEIAQYYRKSSQTGRSVPNSVQQHLADTRRNSESTKSRLPSPPSYFSDMRKVMVVDFFILHFIGMIDQFLRKSAKTKAAGLVMHVENLCRLCLELNVQLERTHLDRATIKTYQEKCLEFRKQIGSAMEDYCLETLNCGKQGKVNFKDCQAVLLKSDNWSFQQRSSEKVFIINSNGWLAGKYENSYKHL